jgi:hypothetical protein
MLKNQLDTPNAYRNARTALLNAVDVIRPYAQPTLVGGQALHLHTAGKVDINTPELTVDADLMLEPALVQAPPPPLEEVLTKARFTPLDPSRPGLWQQLVTVPEFQEPVSVEVDLMVPASLTAGRRGARLGGHGKHVAAKTPGLDGVLVDRAPQLIRSLREGDAREYTLDVAGPGALFNAKMFKIRDRLRDGGSRVKNKDAADVLRLLIATETDTLAGTLKRLLADGRSSQESAEALNILLSLAGKARDPMIAMAQEALRTVDDPDIIGARFVVLVAELREALADTTWPEKPPQA